MRVIVRTINLEEAWPEIIPFVRQAGEKFPLKFEVEAMPTVESQKELDLRKQFPEYWTAFTMTEWVMFVQLFCRQEVSRMELVQLTCASIGGKYERRSGKSMIRMSNIADVHIKNLRRQLRLCGDKHHIFTKRGYGYIFRDGPDPIPHSMGLYEPQKKRKKPLNADGTLAERHPYRQHKNILNAVEYGYLHEMKMDEIPMDEAGKVFGITGKALEWAWEAKNYDKYISATFLHTLK